MLGGEWYNVEATLVYLMYSLQWNDIMSVWVQSIDEDGNYLVITQQDTLLKQLYGLCGICKEISDMTHIWIESPKSSPSSSIQL